MPFIHCEEGASRHYIKSKIITSHILTLHPTQVEQMIGDPSALRNATRAVGRGVMDHLARDATALDEHDSDEVGPRAAQLAHMAAVQRCPSHALCRATRMQDSGCVGCSCRYITRCHPCVQLQTLTPGLTLHWLRAGCMVSWLVDGRRCVCRSALPQVLRGPYAYWCAQESLSYLEAQVLVWACCEAAMTTLLLRLQLRAAEKQM